MEISITVNSNSKTSEVIRIDNKNYKIKVDSPAIEGKANKRLIEILSNHFNVPKSSICIVRGLKSKKKTIKIDL